MADVEVSADAGSPLRLFVNEMAQCWTPRDEFVNLTATLDGATDKLSRDELYRIAVKHFCMVMKARNLVPRLAKKRKL